MSMTALCSRPPFCGRSSAEGGKPFDLELSTTILNHFLMSLPILHLARRTQPDVLQRAFRTQNVVAALPTAGFRFIRRPSAIRSPFCCRGNSLTSHPSVIPQLTRTETMKIPWTALRMAVGSMSLPPFP
eukprot:EG_transcript_49419